MCIKPGKKKNSYRLRVAIHIHEKIKNKRFSWKVWPLASLEHGAHYEIKKR
jgi:hypothetical protein